MSTMGITLEFEVILKKFSQNLAPIGRVKVCDLTISYGQIKVD